jgi:hypothetical protein
MMKCYATEIHIYEDDLSLMAIVSGYDECSAKIEIKSELHTKESWQELSAAIGEAIDRLELQ